MYIYQIMSSNFGFIDIILLAMIAGFIILRLRNILGRRTGHQDQDKMYSEFSDKKFKDFKSSIKSKVKKPQTEFDANEKKQFLKGEEIAYETILTSICISNDSNISAASFIIGRSESEPMTMLTIGLMLLLLISFEQI